MSGEPWLFRLLSFELSAESKGCPPSLEVLCAPVIEPVEAENAAGKAGRDRGGLLVSI